MQYYLYRTNKRVGSTKVPSGTSTASGYLDNGTARLLAPTTMEAPTLIFEKSDAVMNHNYLKLQWSETSTGQGQSGDWRLYFRTQLVLLDNNRVQCTYVEDAVGTWWNDIKNTYVRVSRTNDYALENSWFTDPFTVQTGKQTYSILHNSSPFTVDTGYYIIGMTLKNANVSTARVFCTQGAVNYYLISASGLTTFIDDLSKLSGKMADINPMQYVVSCRYIPFTLSDIMAMTNRTFSQQNYNFTFNIFDPAITTYTVTFYKTGAVSNKLVYEGIPFDNPKVGSGHVSRGIQYYEGSNQFSEVRQAVIDQTGDDPSDDGYGILEISDREEGAYRNTTISFAGQSPSSTLLSSVCSYADSLSGTLVPHTQGKKYLNEAPFLESYLYAGPYGVIPLNYNVAKNYRYIIDLDFVTGVSTLTLTSGTAGIVYTKKDAIICPSVTLAQMTSNSFIAMESAKMELRGAKIAAWNNMAANLSRAGSIGSQISGLGAQAESESQRLVNGLAGAGWSVAQQSSLDMGRLVTQGNAVQLASSVVGLGISVGTTFAAYSLANDINGLQNYQASLPQNTVRFANESFEALALPWDYVQVEYEVILPDYNAVGYPVYNDMTLASCEGITIADGTKLVTDKWTLLERNMILESLKNGIYVE